MKRNFSGGTVGQNTSTEIRVNVQNYAVSGGPPVITSRSTLKTVLGYVVDKWVRLHNRSLFANGQVAKGSIILGSDSAAAGYTKIDPRRVSTDFTYNLEQQETPTTGSTIPQIKTTKTIGTAGTATVLRVSEVRIPLSSTLKIYTEGDVKITGNGDVMGAVVATNITINEAAAFHYDESLAAIYGDFYAISNWQELTSKANRDAVASLAGF